MPTTALLPSRTAIAISGEEAGSFLNGLITANVHDVDAGAPAYGALLTPQGKILFDFFVLKDRDRYLVDCSAEQKPELIKRLVFYRLRAKVDVADRSDELGVAAAWDGGDLPGSSYEDPRGAAAGRRSICPHGELEGVEDAGEAAYLAHRIALGLADSDLDIGSGELFPHEANLDQINGVHFVKGCYVGQEVVSRMHHKAKVRKRIVIAHGGENPLRRGAEISIDGKASGIVLSTLDSEGLALVRLDRLRDAHADAGEVSADGVPIAFSKPDWAAFEMPGVQDR